MAMHRILENDEFIIDYSPDDKTYRVNFFNDGHFWSDCEFTALIDNMEPIAYAHWVYGAHDGTWWTSPEYGWIVDKRPICSHCGNKFGSAALDYKRCPMCGAHMLTIEEGVKLGVFSDCEEDLTAKADQT